MIKTPSKIALTVIALLGVSAAAMADPGHRHEVRRLEARLRTLQFEKRSDVRMGHMRAAARDQREIDRTRALLDSVRH